MSATAVVTLAVASGCGSSDHSLGGSSLEPATGANKVVRIGVDTGGSVSVPTTTRVPAGTDVKVVLNNASSDSLQVRVTGPRKREQLQFMAPAGKRGQGNVVLGNQGRYRVTVRPAGQQPGSSGAAVDNSFVIIVSR